MISVLIYFDFCPCQYRPNFELIRNLKRCLSCCFDCPCATAMWSGCDASAIAPAKNAKPNKTKEKNFGLHLAG